MTITPPSIQDRAVRPYPVEVVMKPTILRRDDGSFDWIERPVFVTRDASGKIVSERFEK